MELLRRLRIFSMRTTNYKRHKLEQEKSMTGINEDLAEMQRRVWAYETLI